jgi:hypothetical protein
MEADTENFPHVNRRLLLGRAAAYRREDTR